MNNLEDIIFNPNTGLFENKSDPTAHLSPKEIRASKRNRAKDPEVARMKPRINFFRHDKENNVASKGDSVCISWNVDNADFVKIKFPDGNNVEFPTAGSTAFIMPATDCDVVLVAYHGKVKTQRTIKVQRISKMNQLFRRIF